MDDVDLLMRRRAGFTLLEVCLAITIGLLLLGLAVPSITSLLAEKKLKESFDGFDELVRKAQKLSVSEQRTFMLRGGAEGIVLAPGEVSPGDSGKEWGRLDLQKGEVIEFDRPAALSSKPPMEWAFWRSGTCEPVVITYNGPSGRWVVKYDALSARGTFNELTAR